MREATVKDQRAHAQRPGIERHGVVTAAFRARPIAPLHLAVPVDSIAPPWPRRVISFLPATRDPWVAGLLALQYQKGTLTARFSAANQVLTLQNSAGGGLAADDPEGRARRPRRSGGRARHRSVGGVLLGGSAIAGPGAFTLWQRAGLRAAPMPTFRLSSRSLRQT